MQCQAASTSIELEFPCWNLPDVVALRVDVEVSEKAFLRPLEDAQTYPQQNRFIVERQNSFTVLGW